MKTRSLLISMMISIALTLTAQIKHVPADHESIQAGIDAATDGDTVLVAHGTYYENIYFKGKAITLASQYILDGDTSHITNTVIDGSQAADPDRASVVSFNSGEDTLSVLQGFTIQGGLGFATSNTSYASMRVGGGIMCNNAAPSILNNKIWNNSVTDSIAAFGGGLSAIVDSNAFRMIVKGNDFRNNSCIVIESTDGFVSSGGGLYISENATVEDNSFYYNTCIAPVLAGGGGASFESPLASMLWNIQFNGNDVQYNTIQAGINIFGAGLHVFDADAFVDGNIISNNTATSDFAVISPGANFFQFTFGGETVFTNNTVTDNIATGVQDGWGTGFNISHPTSPVLISGNYFSNNQMTTDGIAYGTISIWVYFDGHAASQTPITIEGNRFEMNEAETGTGIVAFNSFNTAISNNLFYGNDATEFDGGAIFLREMGAKKGMEENAYLSQFGHKNFIPDEIEKAGEDQTISSITNNTFYDNSSANLGGAIYCDYRAEHIVAFNNIFWENEASVMGDDIYVDDTSSLLIAYSDINEDNIEGPWKGEGNFFGDPLLDTEHVHLTESSPCIDAGADSVMANDINVAAPQYDIDGEERPLGNGIDVGADEYLSVGMDSSEHDITALKLSLFPNPFQDHAEIEFKMEKSSHCKLSLYDLSGKWINDLVNNHLIKGNHHFNLNTSGLPSGTYYLKLSTAYGSTSVKALKYK
jgi:predicted outer membrane repeat protein